MIQTFTCCHIYCYMQGTGPAEAGKFLQYWARVEFWVSAPLISQLLTSWPLPKIMFSCLLPLFLTCLHLHLPLLLTCFLVHLSSPGKTGLLVAGGEGAMRSAEVAFECFFPFSCCAKTCFPLDIEAIVCPYPCLRPPLPDRGLRHGYQSLARCGQQRPVAISLISQGGWKLSPIC